MKRRTYETRGTSSIGCPESTNPDKKPETGKPITDERPEPGAKGAETATPDHMG